jgi:hypothetical protein
VTIGDFYAYMPMHCYIFSPSREMWPASSVNARISRVPVDDKKILASTWLDKNRAVEQMTWAPGEPMMIRDRLIADGGWIERQRRKLFQSLPAFDNQAWRSEARYSMARPYAQRVRRRRGPHHHVARAPRATAA